MLKALYDFQAVYPKTISFDEGEYFILYQTSIRQRNWWQVVSMKGNIGFVPSNYVIKIKVEADFLISFLNSSIESLERSEETEINGIMPRAELLARLREKKINMEGIYSDNTEHDIDSSMSFSQSLSEKFSKSSISLPNGEACNSQHQQNKHRQKTQSLRQQRNRPQSNPEHTKRLDGSKKSISSPTIGIIMPRRIHESSSLESMQVQTQNSQQQQQQMQQNQQSPQSTQPVQSKINDIAQDNSITSETSTTTTTTSEDVMTTYREPSLKDTSSNAYSLSIQQFNTNPQQNGLIKDKNDLNDKDIYVNCINTVKVRYYHDENKKSIDSNDGTGSDDRDMNDQLDELVNSVENSQAFDSVESSLSSKQGDQQERSKQLNKSVVDIVGESNRKVASSDVYQIVDAIRHSTNMSFDTSCEALRVVLTSMEQLYNGAINPYLEAIAIHVTDRVETPRQLLGMTHDSKRLQYIFSQLTDCKNDVQQRSWMVYEDEEDIIQFLEELVEILNNADEQISCHEMSSDQYQALINLIQYYQMETRWPIKSLLLKVFTAACHLDAIIVDILVTSVLPVEIVEDIKVQFTTLERLKELIKMLTIIFCLGQPMPVNHQDYLGVQFTKFLFDTIESHNLESFVDMLITLILAFNLQFTDPLENPIVESMHRVDTVKVFTERILLLLNRGEDPVKILKHPSKILNSVLKIFIDIFSVKKAADLFYTTDNKVLIDIVARELSDLCAGNPLRRYYLELCRRILRNTDYPEHQHRKQDFMKIFTRIFCEDTEWSSTDQQLVREIANEFPQLFKA